MEPAIRPPLAPMLARLVRELPHGDYVYEPKWDGFRVLAFRAGEEIDLRSRHDRPLGRYFPELVEALLELDELRFALDGEVVVATPRGLDFQALMARLHPARSRVERLRNETPAAFIAFDLLGRNDEALLERPFVERRTQLAELLAGASPPLFLTPATGDPRVAESWLERFRGAGVDGVVAKHVQSRYEPGARTMVKVKLEQTADCVVAGFRWLLDRPGVASLLLGLYDDEGTLHHIGVSSSFTQTRRRELLEELSPLVVELAGHPWQHGYLLGGGHTGRLAGSAGRWTPDMEHDWAPLAPVRVAEVAYDQLDGLRFRHPARFVRWRPDRDARSCTLDQLHTETAPLEELLPLCA